MGATGRSATHQPLPVPAANGGRCWLWSGAAPPAPAGAAPGAGAVAQTLHLSPVQLPRGSWLRDQAQQIHSNGTSKRANLEPPQSSCRASRHAQRSERAARQNRSGCKTDHQCTEWNWSTVFWRRPPIKLVTNAGILSLSQISGKLTHAKPSDNSGAFRVLLPVLGT